MAKGECSSSAALRAHIECEIGKRGEPVRWAIVGADEDGVRVEGVVSRSGKEAEAPATGQIDGAE